MTARPEGALDAGLHHMHAPHQERDCPGEIDEGEGRVHPLLPARGPAISDTAAYEQRPPITSRNQRSTIVDSAPADDTDGSGRARGVVAQPPRMRPSESYVSSSRASPGASR